MAKKKGWFSSLIEQKCPQCRVGKPFLYPTFSTNFLKMHEKCQVCGLDLEPEPGFYWGAMYITYGFNTGLAIVVSVILYLGFGNPSLWVYIAVIGALSLILAPVSFRYSRLILLYGLGGAKFTDKYLNEDK